MDIDKQRDDFTEKLSFILGIAHGGIATILDHQDCELREKINDLKAKLDSLIGDLYYSGKH
tara:strand:- start:12975 stop:13157 length:183 start_codon:yes stop_codon:yes gene_type:complete